MLKPIPKNKAQKDIIRAIETKDMVLIDGPAGTGKTFITACMAAETFKRKLVKNIVITRPTLGVAGRTIGYFPGSLGDKMSPWCAPILEVLKDCFGKGNLEKMINNGEIEIVPFEVIRGRSFQDTFVILDEAQNCVKEELLAFVTRHGEGSISVLNGDTRQCDLGNKRAYELFLDYAKLNPVLQKHCAVIRLTTDDIVRSPLCKAWAELESL